MAQRRMIQKDLITSAWFMDISNAAQNAYFRFCIVADDDGFVHNPKLYAANKQTLKTLEDVGLIYTFPSGIVLVRHWFVHNRLRKDTTHETIYTTEKALVTLDEHKIYQLKSVEETVQTRNEPVTETVRTRNESAPQYSIDKDSVGKDSAVKESEAEDSLAKDSLAKERADKDKTEKPVTTGASGDARSDIASEKNFLLFWNAYPKKEHEDLARTTFMGLQESFQEIMEGLEYHKKSNQWVSDQGFFIPKAHNWLNRKAWKERPPLYKPKTEPLPNGAQAASGHLGPEELAAIRRALAEN